MPILDLYDDPRGVVLSRHLVRSSGTLPDKLASFAPSENAKLASLPDRLFALVGTVDGETVRKYAMHDPEHLATSIVYFLDCGGALPDAVRQKVAMNLITGCGWYETAPPVALTKVALLGAVVNTGLALTSAPGQLREAKAKNQQGDAAFRAAQMTGVKEAGRAVHVQDGDTNEAWRALDKFIRGDESLEDMRNGYDNDYPNLFADPSQAIKAADLRGTEIHSQGGLSSDPRGQTPQKRFALPPKVSAALPLRVPFNAATHGARQEALAGAMAGKQKLYDKVQSAAHSGPLSDAKWNRVKSIQNRIGQRQSSIAHEGQMNNRKAVAQGLPEIGARKLSADHQMAGSFSFREAEVPEVDAARHYALPHLGLYPIDTAQEVKTASAYFVEHVRDLSMDDRRVFASSVAARAEDLGVKVASQLEKVASQSYGPHIVGELHGRIRALEGTGKEAAYQVLLENLDATPPLVCYDMLKLADDETGIDQGYGRPVTGFRDPLSAVFGAPENPIYSWSAKGQYVTEEILRSYSKLVPDLDKVIEKDFTQKFVEDPIKAFDRLPEAKKIIMARLANGEAFRWI